MPAIIGIDLGTTYSAMATLDETGRPKLIEHTGNKVRSDGLTPSCVMISKNDAGKTIVGEAARKCWGTENPSKPETHRSAARFKREMGSSKTYSLRGQEFSPTQLSTLVLKKLLQDAEAQLGEIGDAVVTIPANFGHEARDATMHAAKAAGLNVKYIINEPTAAALYYAYNSGIPLGGIYAVYDLGGGTFDVSIIRVNGHDVEVLATEGVQKLGGDDFDAALQEVARKKYKELAGEELDPLDFSKNEAEEQKKSLSTMESVDFLVNRKLLEITRAEFEESISSLTEQTVMLTEIALDEADVDPSDVQQVFLAGGSTRIPAIRNSVAQLFGKQPVCNVNPDEVVALGAALYAAYKGDRSQLTPMQAQSVGMIKVQESTGKHFGTVTLEMNEIKNEIELSNTVIIPRGTKIPCKKINMFSTASDNQTEIECKVTECKERDTPLQFVHEIGRFTFNLPAGRPAGQDIRVTYEYTANQMLVATFLDVSSGKEITEEFRMIPDDNDPHEGSPAPTASGVNIDDFLVE